MSKYKPLSERLAGQAGDEWRASFDDVEGVLGFSLPKSARTSGAWWSAADKAHHQAWLAQGWKVAAVDRTLGSVVFRRDPRTVEPPRPELQSVSASDNVQPVALKEAAEAAARKVRGGRATGVVALATAALVTVGLVLTAAFRRR
jgi:uncharacterized protein YcaQ